MEVGSFCQSDRCAIRSNGFTNEAGASGSSDTVQKYVRGKELGISSASTQNLRFLSRPGRPIYQKDVKGHCGCVNALETSFDENYVASGGDDRRVFLWHLDDLQAKKNAAPVATMKQRHDSNIFSVAFSHRCERLYTAGNDSTFHVHNIATTNLIRTYRAHEPIYHVSTNPVDDNVVISASEDGQVRLHDLRCDGPTVLVSSTGTMYSAQFNPRLPYYIAVCNGTSGMDLHDIRKSNSPCFQFDQITPVHMNEITRSKSFMYGQWSDDGEAILATRSRSVPILYNLETGGSVEFVDTNYTNSCTVKSCAFITQDLVMTGSDDWNIYIWKVPERNDQAIIVESAYRVLEGHRSIVNHCRYSPRNRLLFSSGVEKIIKVWSEWQLNGSYLEPRKRTRSIHHPLPRTASDDIEEDTNMLNFFDVLVAQRNGYRRRIIVSTHAYDYTDLPISWELFGGISGLQRREQDEGTMYVVSSPEMSEVEMLSDVDVDTESSESSFVSPESDESELNEMENLGDNALDERQNISNGGSREGD